MIYFVTGCNLDRDFMWDPDSSTEEYKQAQKKISEYEKNVVEKAKEELKKKYPEFNDWLFTRFHIPSADPFMSHLYDIEPDEEDDDYCEMPPADMKRPSYEEIQAIMRLDRKKESFLDDVPRKSYYVWRIMDQKMFGFFNSLDEVKKELEGTSDELYKKFDNYSYLFIEGFEPGFEQYATQENALLYDLSEKKWMNYKVLNKYRALIENESLTGRLGFHFIKAF